MRRRRVEAEDRNILFLLFALQDSFCMCLILFGEVSLSPQRLRINERFKGA